MEVSTKKEAPSSKNPVLSSSMSIVDPHDTGTDLRRVGPAIACMQEMLKALATIMAGNEKQRPDYYKTVICGNPTETTVLILLFQ